MRLDKLRRPSVRMEEVRCPVDKASLLVRVSDRCLPMVTDPVLRYRACPPISRAAAHPHRDTLVLTYLQSVLDIRQWQLPYHPRPRRHPSRELHLVHPILLTSSVHAGIFLVVPVNLYRMRRTSVSPVNLGWCKCQHCQASLAAPCRPPPAFLLNLQSLPAVHKCPCSRRALQSACRYRLLSGTQPLNPDSDDKHEIYPPHSPSTSML
jgi:hypothetical protein